MNYKVGETQFEQEWVEKEIPKHGWTYRKDLSNVDVERLVNHLKQIIEKRNNIKFNENEWNKFVLLLDTSFITKCQLIRETIPFTFDNNTKEDIVLIDFHKPENNIYEVIHQITDGRHRYDVSFLINGLPVLHCELKKPGCVDIWRAFNQIIGYKKDKMHWLFGYTNIYMISDGISTKLFANNDKLSQKQAKDWTNFDNTKIGKIEEIDKVFVKTNTLLDFLHRFVLIDNKQLIIARPYQYHAVQKCINQVLTTNKGGYVFHSTGSGKTLTSYLLSRDLSRDEKIDKVLFVIDRNDLGTQTQDNFSKYASWDSKVNIKYDVDNTNDLVQKLSDKNTKLIITSIQKLAGAIRNTNNHTILNVIKNRRIVFIYDECHRSQAGDMRDAIDKFFNKPQTIGFTGTPIYKISQTVNGLRTEDIFGECLHTYSIMNSVTDENTLYYIPKYLGQYEIIKEDDKKTSSLDWNAFFQSDKWINNVCEYINKTFSDLTKNEYGAMLTVSTIVEAYKCWKRIREINKDINVGCIFSIDPDGEETGEEQTTSKEKLKEILDTYNKDFGSNYGTHNYYAYQKNLSDLIKSGKINLIIVVNVFTTGFDAPKLNTLYVARELKMHNLIQTFARVCRTDGEKKPWGNIRCLLRIQEKDVEEAFSYYAKGVEIDKSIPVMAIDYQVIVNSINDVISKIKQIAPTSEEARNLSSEQDVVNFMHCIKKLAFTLDNHFLTFDEKDWSDLNMSYDEILEYRSISGSLLQKYKEIIALMQDKVNPEPYVDITFDDLMSRTQKTEIRWMEKIAKAKTKGDRDKILHSLQMQYISESNLKPISELIKEYLDRFIDKFPEASPEDIKEALNHKVEEFWNKCIMDRAQNSGLEYEFLKNFFKKYNDNTLTKSEWDIVKQEIRHKLNKPFKEFDKTLVDIYTTFDTIIAEQKMYETINW